MKESDFHQVEDEIKRKTADLMNLRLGLATIPAIPTNSNGGSSAEKTGTGPTGVGILGNRRPADNSPQATALRLFKDSLEYSMHSFCLADSSCYKYF